MMADDPRPPETEQNPGDDFPQAEPMARQKQSSDELSSWHRLAGVGVEFVVAFGVFAWLGWWLDKRFATGPWLLIAGCAIGFSSGMWILVKAAQKMMK